MGMCCGVSKYKAGRVREVSLLCALDCFEKLDRDFVHVG